VSIHPNCCCVLIRIPQGWGFDKDGELTPKGEFGVRYDSEEDIELALKQENDLIKSVALGHVDFQGMPISIENAPGTVRHWKAPDGTQGDTHMLMAYGYVDGSNGHDGDEIDVFIGPNPHALMVYIVHQQNPNDGRFDESKAMIGFNSEQQAISAYQLHYNRPDFAVTVSPMDMDHFKRWAYGTGKTEDIMKKSKPDIKLVIPLKKSLETEGHISPEMVTSSAEFRSPGPGLGANYLFNIPKRQRGATLAEMGFTNSPREMLDTFKLRKKQGKKNKEDYEVREPLPEGSMVRPIEIPDGWNGMEALVDEQAIEHKKKLLIKEGMKNTAAVKNNVEIK
jgi:hypothetical protein